MAAANPRRATKSSSTRPKIVKTVPMQLAPIQLSQNGDESSEREPLFAIGDKVYTIPVEVPVGDVLTYITLAVEEGDVAALVFAMRSALGDEGYAALCAHKALKQKELGQVMAACRAKFDGALAGPKDKPDND